LVRNSNGEWVLIRGHKNKLQGFIRLQQINKIDNNQMAIVAIDTPICTVSTKQEAETANKYFQLVEEVQSKLQAIVKDVNVENKPAATETVNPLLEQ
jgi:hypothetical protein